MTAQEYLESVLREQTIPSGSEEMAVLQAHRKKVEEVIRAYFAESTPTIQHGGSRAKDTMIRESYDLDIICYFSQDNSAGDNLKEIYENVETALSKDYSVERKTSALRLVDLTSSDDLRIDVVPGRFVDNGSGDVFLYQHTGEKERLKTNLQTHIDHIKGSGVTEAIKLLKLWRIRNRVPIKTFALELLVVDILQHHKTLNLPSQLMEVFRAFRDDIDHLSIEDPANPTGNDLSELLNQNVRGSLSALSASSLKVINDQGWEGLFGPIQNGDRVASMENLAITIPAASQHKPWTRES